MLASWHQTGNRTQHAGTEMVRGKGVFNILLSKLKAEGLYFPVREENKHKNIKVYLIRLNVKRTFVNPSLLATYTHH